MVRLIGISGSLRQASLNTALLRVARDRMPESARLDIASIAEIPLYNADLEAEAGIPPAVRALQAQIRAADGVLIATPEYNHSIPGVVKNAIDWLSRGGRGEPRVLQGRAVALIGASPGLGGTRFSQTAWLPVLHTLGAQVFAGGEYYLAGAGQAFDADGGLADEKSRGLLDKFLAGFVAFVAESRSSTDG